MMVRFGTVATLLAAFSPAAATTLLRGASDDPVEALAREQHAARSLGGSMTCGSGVDLCGVPSRVLPPPGGGVLATTIRSEPPRAP